MVGNILAVGLMSLGMGMSSVKDEPQMRANAQETITLPGSYTYESLYYVANKYLTLSNTAPETPQTVEIEGIEGTYTHSDVTDSIIKTELRWSNPNSYSNNTVDYKFYYTLNAGGSYALITLDIQNSEIHSGANTVNLTEYPEQWTYWLNQEEEPNMGNDIISTIASGLGIIGALATTFLTGFGNLFYSRGALTPFAIFSLVMLGVAVSFAVVKLVLNLIRSNTGA